MPSSMNKFVLVINSTDYYQRFTNVNDQSYMLNNTNIPEGNYRCRWSFRSSLESTAAPNVFPTIYLRTASVQQAYSVGATGGSLGNATFGTISQGGGYNATNGSGLLGVGGGGGGGLGSALFSINFSTYIAGNGSYGGGGGGAGGGKYTTNSVSTIGGNGGNGVILLYYS